MVTSVLVDKNRINHNPDGIATDFVYDFQVNDIDWMLVFADGDAYLEPFTMTGLTDPAGGLVQFTVPPLGSIEIMTLIRIVPLTQRIVYPVYGPFPPKSHEAALDKLTFITQQLQESDDRSMKMDVYDQVTDTTMPAPSAGRVLIWNQTEDRLVNGAGEDTFDELARICVEAAQVAVEARDQALVWEGFSMDWATEARGVLVDDGVNPPGYSAFSWKEGAYVWATAPFEELIDDGTHIGYSSYHWSRISSLWGSEARDVLVDDGINPPGYSAYHWENYCIAWATAPVDQLVDDGINPENYSAYHWAMYAQGGGIIDIFSSDSLMISIETPAARYRGLLLVHGTPGGLVKLSSQGTVPLDNLPYAGSIRLIAALEGHNRCPKYTYTIPDETPCAEPDYRNPSERWPSIPWLGGDYFAITGVDELPDLNQMNLINPATQLYEVTEVSSGDAVFWLDGAGGVSVPGWYLSESFVGDDLLLAENVLFDDAFTVIKGQNVQLWNQAADTVIDLKIDRAGDLMTGDLTFMNFTGISSFLNDGTTPTNLIRINTNNQVLIGGDNGSVINGATLINCANEIAIQIDGLPVSGYAAFDRRISLPNNVTFRIENAAGSAVPIFYVDTLDRLIIGSSAQPVEALIYAAGVLALNLAANLATFSDNVLVPNSSEYRSLSTGGASVRLLRIDASNNIQLGGTVDQTGRTIIYNAGNLAIDITGSPNSGFIYFDRNIRVPNTRSIWGRDNADTVDINLIRTNGQDYVVIGGTAESISTIIFAGITEAIVLTATVAAFSGHVDIPNNRALRGITTGAVVRDLIRMASSNDLYVGTTDTPVSRIYGTTVRIQAGTVSGSKIDCTAAGAVDITPLTDLKVISNGVSNLVASDAGTEFQAPTSHDVIIASGVSGAVTVDFSDKTHQVVNATGNATFTFIAPPDGTHCYLRSYAYAGVVLTWPAIFWANGDRPPITSVNTERTIFLVYEGAAWWASYTDFVYMA